MNFEYNAALVVIYASRVQTRGGRSDRENAMVMVAERRRTMKDKSSFRNVKCSRRLGVRGINMQRKLNIISPLSASYNLNSASQ